MNLLKCKVNILKFFGNVQLNREQKKICLQWKNSLGEDGMMDIANNLENFGLGMSDSADFIKKKNNDDATKIRNCSK